MKKSLFPLLFLCLIAFNTSFAQGQKSWRETATDFLKAIVELDMKGFYDAGEVIPLAIRKKAFNQYTKHPIYGNADQSLKFVRTVPMDWDLKSGPNVESPTDIAYVVVVFERTSKEQVSPTRAVTDLFHPTNWGTIATNKTAQFPSTEDVFHKMPKGFSWGKDKTSQAVMKALVGQDTDPNNYVTVILKKDPTTGSFNIGMPPTVRFNTGVILERD